MIHSSLEITPLAPTFVSLVTGIDIAKGVDPQTLKYLSNALMESKVLVIRNQQLSPQQYAEFGRQWSGETRVDSFTEMHLKGFDDINVIGNIGELFEQDGYRNGANFWHTDCAAEPNPDATTMLFCIHALSQGGETTFADMQAAYEALNEEFRQQIDELQSWHCYSGARPILGGREEWEHTLTTVTEETAANLPPPVVRPLVRRHSITKQKSLYAPAGSAFAIEGLDTGEANALMHRLKLHATRLEFCYSHQYQPGDLVMWDNSSTMHCSSPIPPATGEKDRRLLYRICPLGLPQALASGPQ